LSGPLARLSIWKRGRVSGNPDIALLSGGRMARGCELCFPGLKAVIFVTGLCDDGCFYCPVSRDRLGHDVFYVNEERVNSVEEAVAEVQRQGAQGASLTGGDPLVRFDRSLRLVEALKEAFSSSFHIHLYTSGRYATPSLDKAGLDEIRFHPTRPGLEERARLAKTLTSMKVGFEIPIAPGLEGWARKLILYADRVGLDFVNLNEMEIVDPNARSLLLRGYRVDPARRFAVKGSLEAAVKVLEWASREVSVPVHFCPASFKDRVQTWNRLRRTAELDQAWYEDRVGALVRWGILRGPGGRQVYSPPDAKLLGSLAREYGWEAAIVEAHPTRYRRPVVSESSLGEERRVG